MAQVSRSHYHFLSYNHPRRFASYFQQIALITGAGAQSVLEVGPGDGFIKRNLPDRSLPVTTIDFDESLGPDVVADVRCLPFPDRRFDAVCAFQVLEHLPWEDVGKAIREMKRCAAMAVLLSLPDAGSYVQVQTRLPFVGTRRWMIELDRFWRRKHRFDGQHYWEVGTAGHSKELVRQRLECGSWAVVEATRLFANPYHRFYTLKRRDGCR
jgi:SAM-dependent methyltransferase